MNGLLMQYFGGVSTRDPAGIYAYVLVMGDLIRWLLPIAVCLLLVGARLERRRGIELLAGCRYGTAGRWWRSRFWDSQRFGMRAGIVMLAAAAALDAVTAAVSAGAAATFDAAASVPIAEAVSGTGGAVFHAAAASVPVAAAVSDMSGAAASGLSVLLWLAHMAVVLSLLLLLDLTAFRRFAAGALLLLEGLTFLEGVADRRLAPFMWGMWGMYRQSARYDSRFGISSGAALLLEGGLLLFFYRAGCVRQKRAGEKR